MRVAIVGSRDYPLLDEVRKYVRSLPKGTVVISGGARGVDSVAVSEAKLQGLDVEEYLPDWNRYDDLRAGLLRNETIVDACDELVAFWDGESRGTRHAISIANKNNKLSFVFRCDNPSQGRLF